MAWKLACMLIPCRTCNPTVRFSKYELSNKLLGDVTFFRIRTYTTCNSTVGFVKYEFNNKWLGGVTFFRITSSLSRTQLYIS